MGGSTRRQDWWSKLIFPAVPSAPSRLRRQQYVVTVLQEAVLADPPEDLEYRSIGELIFPSPRHGTSHPARRGEEGLPYPPLVPLVPRVDTGHRGRMRPSCRRGRLRDRPLQLRHERRFRFPSGRHLHSRRGDHHGRRCRSWGSRPDRRRGSEYDHRGCGHDHHGSGRRCGLHGQGAQRLPADPRSRSHGPSVGKRPGPHVRGLSHFSSVG